MQVYIFYQYMFIDEMEVDIECLDVYGALFDKLIKVNVFLLLGKCLIYSFISLST
jgi:hypothetical protein